MPNRPVFRLLVLLLLALPGTVYTQDFPMIHYTVDDGLPSNTVYYVFRSSRGNLWAATDKGVAKYNGIKFEKYTTFDGLADNEVFFFCEDHEGRIWLASYNGELCFFKNGRFYTAANTPFLRLPFKASFIRQITIEKDSSVNIRFYNNTRFININHEHCTAVDLKNLTVPIDPEHVLNIEKVNGNLYTIYTGTSSISTDTNCTNVTTAQISLPELKDKKDVFWSLAFTQNQRYLYNQYYVYDLALKPLRPFRSELYKDTKIYELYYNERGWFYTTSRGLILNDTVNILPGYNVSCLAQDNQQNYWASTLDNGVFVIDRNFGRATISRNAYKGKVEYCYADSNNVFFVSSDHVISRLHKGHFSSLYDFSKFMIPNASFQTAGFLIDSNYCFYNCYSYQSLVVDHITAKQPVAKLYTNTFVPYSAIKTVCKAGDYLYLNVRSHIAMVNYEQYKNEDRLININVSGTSVSERVFCMAKDAENHVWYSTVDKMYKVVNGIRQEQARFSGKVFKQFDFYGNYLVGYTHNNQLYVCNNVHSDIQLIQVTGQNCIWDHIYRIDASHVLISTNNLYRLITFNTGNKANPFSIQAVENQFVPVKTEAVCSDEKLCYFFSEGSVTSIPVDNLFLKPPPPRLYYRFLKTGRKEYQISGELELPFKESKNITITFSTVSNGGKKVFYQYSVSRNNQESWRDIDVEEINLFNSGYGTYEVKVKARTLSSDFCEPVTFTLHIDQPFWTTWWFILLVVVILLGCIALIIRYRIRIAIQKKDKEYNMEIKFMRSEYKALNALMNPHFIFNTLNNVQGLVNRNDKLAANEYLRVFADLVRQNMHNVSKELIPLQREIDLVANYLKLEKLRFKDLLNYTIETDSNVDLSDIMVPPLLVQPLVENSIKHGILPRESAEGMIGIHIFERADTVYIEVRDNGIGMSPAGKTEQGLHESFGLDNIKKRIEQLSIIQNKKMELTIREVKDETGRNQWTIITISIPITY